MAVKNRTLEILNILDEMYGTDRVCYLEHSNAWQLIVATILSAQCTDARVNIVTRQLFLKYPTVDTLAYADIEDVEKIIKPVGFYHNKAKNIIGCSKMIHEEFLDEVPRRLEDLVKLPGVGRKTANVIRGNIYNDPSIVVDTHVKRISKKLGLTTEDDPEKIEYELMKVLPKEHWILYNIQIITFVRDICKAINPQCSECRLSKYCKNSK